MYIKAFTVAIIVGSILLCINQFDALFGQDKLRIIPIWSRQAANYSGNINLLCAIYCFLIWQ